MSQLRLGRATYDRVPTRRMRRDSKSRYRALAAALPLLLAAVACSSSTTKGGSQSSEPGASLTGGGTNQQLSGTLEVADWRFLQPAVGDRLKGVYQSYSKSHPGVTIKPVAYSFDSYGSTIKTQVGARSGPDIISLNTSWFFALLQAKALAPITGLTSDQAASLAPQNSVAKLDNGQYGLVSTNTIYGFMYNKKLFEQAGIASPPSSFDEFLSDCKQIKQKTGQWGFTARNLVSEASSWWEDFTGTFIPGFGGSWIDGNNKFTVDSDANIAAVKGFKQVYDSGCMLTGETAATFRPIFKQGKVGMMMDNSNAAFTYVEGNDLVTHKDLGTAPSPLPAHKSGFENVFLTVNKYAKNGQVAQDFLKWLFEPEQQKQLADVFAPVTVGTNVLPSSQFVETHPWAQGYYDALKTAWPMGLGDRTYQGDQFATIVMPFIERALQSQLSVEDALKQAQAAVASQLG